MQTTFCVTKTKFEIEFGRSRIAGMGGVRARSPIYVMTQPRRTQPLKRSNASRHDRSAVVSRLSTDISNQGGASSRASALGEP